ncbi:GntR family transcriptional regulator [Lihuaxuella thermophila]|uniref:DNA-binding transcriptional regulator, GntR family n=1 Tax=Lihuaxuella thermophila TaxID=1173111 RepID=A0A1H8J9N6_9BACL|nr:GntR family transcriptional regulator [Lihuaxuella thermophila]SEN76897.1 DNA-binding transcriptional regulator, GntR family [Lihuaxuella thermophila]
MKQLPRPNPLKLQAYTILKEAIIRGEFHDHEMITERSAHERFQISRTPFREAIQTLEAEGWIYSIPYKGTFVSPVTTQDIHDLFEIRLILETYVVNKIQSHMDLKSLKQLETILQSMKVSSREQNDYDFMLLDKDFHQWMFELAGNRRLVAVFIQTSDMIRRIGMRVLHRESRREEVIAEHQQIIDGLKNGRAEEAMVQHLKKQQQSYIDLYRQSI